MSSEKEYSYPEALNRIKDKNIRNSIRNFVILLNQENDKAIAKAKQEAYGKVFDKLDNVTALITKGYFNEIIKIRFKNLKEYNEIKAKLKTKSKVS